MARSNPDLSIVTPDTIFGLALTEMAESGRRIYGPTSFRDYVSRHDLDWSGQTPRYISIDSLNDLAKELREADVMVLRLGSASDGTGTQFALVEARDQIQEFFLLDEDAFDTEQVMEFEPPVEKDKLLSFRLLPKLSETSLVNLALASGALGEALQLDTTGPLMPPATGRSTFSFDVKPHSAWDPVVTHRTGQVEIDTLFGERRDGETALFVIEAKTGTKRSSLAKHKLVYPLLALAEEVPHEIDIVPVYMRCQQVDDEMTFWIAECEVPDPRQRVIGVDEIREGRGQAIRLRIDGS